ncbi:hypothetical protein HYH02_009570 [Chlamydomonas schloesseri]|uniref:non-specific serine/threonine protein kinase n=1 Tax=Chlamydomonas schloesseri TaxID=2026947 RepID=A0A835TQ00_9CHLO|nr:hypothetical protein HYH02_009570 [Chlamydomonas schloesseri]|eukprot:KAG2443160.1 hypothetical protein HYH02_009570 [Chlamydomonas schloesseri]
MGNVLAQPVRVPVDVLADLPGVVMKDTMGGGRFLKTLLCMHDSGGLVVVKVYFKRPDTVISGLEPYKQALAAVRSALAGCPHAWPWQAWLEGPHVAYLVRQHLATNLYDRLSTRPFMSNLEKRWVTFQLLLAAAQVHARGVVHGDIKSENVLLTSWEWLFLADFASGLKPVALPADNPAEYSFYFDTGGRRRAYIAPERFCTSGGGPGGAGAAGAAAGQAGPGGGGAGGGVGAGAGPQGAGAGAGGAAAGGGVAGAGGGGGGGTVPAESSKPPSALTPEMDIFSLGCVIAEVFCDGKALFDLSELLSYRRGDAAADPAGPGSALAGVDPDIRRLVLHMIQLDPAARWPAARYLSDWPEPLFPPYFADVLHPFFASLLPLDADARVAATADAFPRLRREILAASAAASAAAAAAAAAAGAAATDKVGSVAPSAGPSTATGMAPVEPQPPREASTTAAAAADAGGGSAAGGSGAGGGGGGGGGGAGGGGGLGSLSLLEEVGALLADSGTMARRLKAADMEADGAAAGGSGGGGGGGGLGGGMLDAADSDDDVGVGGAFLLDDDLLDTHHHHHHHPQSHGLDSGGAHALIGSSVHADGSGRHASSGVLSGGAGGGGESSIGAAGGAAGGLGPGPGPGQQQQHPHQPPLPVIEEVVTEEVYEYQVREPWGNWQGASGGEDDEALVGLSGPGGAGAGAAGGGGGPGAGAGSAATSGEGSRSGAGGGGAWRGKEEVELPRGGGWQWAGDWVLDMRLGGPGAPAAVDAEGWEYRTPVGGAGGGGAGAAGQRAWSAAPLATCTSRRRRWLRQRRRRLPAAATPPGVGGGAPAGGAGAAAAGAAGSAMTSGGLPRMPSSHRGGAAAMAPASLATGAAAAAAAAAVGADGGDAGVGGGAAAGALALAGTAAGPAGPAGGTAAGTGAAAAAAAPGTAHGLVLVAVLLCSSLRGSRLQESRLAALRLLVAAAEECGDDHVRLQACVPYLLTALHDVSGAVRCAAVRGLVRVLGRVQALPPSDIKVFQDYVLPSMSLTPNDPEEAVRVEYGVGLAHLAAAAHRHLLRLQSDNNAAAATAVAAAAAAAAASGAGAVAGGLSPPPIRYDAEVAAVRALIERGVVELVTGLRSSADVKRALLVHVRPLAEAFGRRGVTELLLPLLITCLNAPEGRLRAAFFRAVGSLGPAHLGGEALDAFLLPCLEQALTDPEPRVVCDAVRCLVAVAPQLRKRSLLAAADKVAPLLRHGSPAVRGAAVAMVAAAARHLPLVDVYAQLAVAVAPHLARLPPLLSDEALLADCLVPQQQQQPGVGAAGGRAGGAGAGAAAGGGRQGSRRSGGGSGRGAAGGVGGGRGVGAGAQADALAAAVDKLSVPLRVGGAGASLAGATGRLDAATGAAGAASGSSGAAAAGGGGGVLPALPLLEGLAGPDDAADLFLRPAAPLYTFDMTLDAAAAAAVAAASEAAGGGGAATAPSGAAVGGAGAGAGGAAGAGSAAAAATLVAASAGAGGIPGPGVSAQAAALAAVPARLAALEARALGLAERLAREPLGVDPLERQQLERLVGLLPRLRADAGTDVRDSAARGTWRLVALSARGPPPMVLPPGGGGDRGGGAGGGGGGGGLSGAVHMGDYFSANTTPTSEYYYSSGDSAAASGGGWWRPRGVLVGHLAEHRRGVNRLAVGAAGCWLVSAANDETVKVWDLRRLERDVSFHSRLTYAAQSGRITALCCCGGPGDAPGSAGPGPGPGGGSSSYSSGTTVASGSSSGSLHLWRPEYTTRQAGLPDKYTGVVAVRQLSPGQGAILEVAPWGPNLLLYVTQRGGVCAWDTRTQRDAWSLPAAPARGLPEHLLADPSPAASWILTGSSRGFLSLWDVRFQQCVHTWQHPLRCPIDALALATGPPARTGAGAAAAAAAGAAGGAGGGRGGSGCPLVWVAAGQGEAGLWDIVNGRCRQVLRCLGPVEAEAAAAVTLPAALTPPSPAASSGGAPGAGAGGAVGAPSGAAMGAGGSALAALGLDAIAQPQPRTAGARCLLSLHGGALLWGGSDAAVRYWDASRPEGSYAVCGPLWPGDSLSDGTPSGGLSVPEYRYKYRTRALGDVAVCEELCVLDNTSRLTESCQELRGRVRVNDQAHADAVTALAVADPPGSSRLLLTASRDGVVKAWK